MTFVKEQSAMLVGKRIEIPVHFDLWMQGARFGKVHSVCKDGGVKVRMDHPQVRKLVKVSYLDFYHCKVG